MKNKTWGKFSMQHAVKNSFKDEPPRLKKQQYQSKRKRELINQERDFLSDGRLRSKEIMDNETLTNL